MDNEKQVNAFVTEVWETVELLDRLREYASSHMELSPDEITWAHVETATRFRNMVQEVLDAVIPG